MNNSELEKYRESEISDVIKLNQERCHNSKIMCPECGSQIVKTLWPMRGPDYILCECGTWYNLVTGVKDGN